MQLRWSEGAAVDLERIADYLFEQTPENAERILSTLYDAPAKLLLFPERGRPGRRRGTREMVLPSLPYLVVYQVSGELVHVVPFFMARRSGLDGRCRRSKRYAGSFIGRIKEGSCARGGWIRHHSHYRRPMPHKEIRE